MPASASDDEENIDTNRGNKLKRNARYVYKGSLTTAEGVPAHPEVCSAEASPLLKCHLVTVV
jgi:hypothetical protein